MTETTPDNYYKICINYWDPATRRQVGISRDAVGEVVGNYWVNEHGSWAMVPEPSTFTLLGLGLLALYMKKAASR